MLKQLYDPDAVVKALYGRLGGSLGSIGGAFGYQGERYAEQGAAGVPKYDPTDHFKLEHHFDALALFDPHKLANQYLTGAIARTSGR